jgi:formiminotetrahydrofolate cyclodeaminase
VTNRRVVAGERIDTWLAMVASEAAEPGSGAVAALVAACGGALVAAAARRTLRRSGAGDRAERLRAIVDEADAARDVLLGLADRDAETFEAAVEAYRLPHGTDDERAERLHVLQGALAEAVDVQLDLARRGVYLLGVADETIRLADPNAAGDALGGAASLHAGALAALANAELNAFAIVDADRRAELGETCAALRERAGALLEAAHRSFAARTTLD